MSYQKRLLAPVDAPAPPKPPQLSLVASALMPDVDTDVFGPGAGPLLAGGGFDATVGRGGIRQFHATPQGQASYRERMEARNALVAAVGIMDELDAKQVEQEAGVTLDTMPESVFPATRGTRWTGGFAYAPENQYSAVLADPCGQTIDLPALPAPAAPTGVQSTGGSLANGTYTYKATAVNANGETVGSATGSVTVSAGGGTASIVLTIIAPPGATAVNVYGRTTFLKIATVNVQGTNAGGATVTYTDTGSVSPSGAIPGANTTGGPGSYGNLPQVGFIPYLIQVEDECSAFDFQVRDYVGRALRLLDNATPAAVETEFWSGIYSQNTLTGPMYDSAGPSLNAFLTQSGTPANGGSTLAAQDLTGSVANRSTSAANLPSVTRGIQILEDYLANTGLGGQGMLHVAPETSPNLLGARRVGPLLLSVMDNIIVPGAGYPTSGATGPIGNTYATPIAGSAWIYATDLVSVRLDKPVVYPTTAAEAIDRGSMGDPNTIRVRAQRFAAATWDNARLAAVQVQLSS